MRKLLAIIFLIIFSLQVVPLKGIGKMLCKSQVAGDMDDDDDGGNDLPPGKLVKFGDDMNLHATSWDPVTGSAYFENKILVFSNIDDTLPSVFVADITSPPPNL